MTVNFDPTRGRHRDQRSLAMHRLIAERVRADPALLLRAQETLARWQGRDSVSRANPWLAEWSSLLASGVDAALAAVLEESSKGESLRNWSPLSVLLPNQERLTFLRDWEAAMQREREARAQSQSIPAEEPTHEALDSVKIPRQGLAAFVADLAQRYDVRSERMPCISEGVIDRNLVTEELMPDSTERLAIALLDADIISGPALVTILGRYLNETGFDANGYGQDSAGQAKEESSRTGWIARTIASYPVGLRVKQSAPPPHNFREMHTGTGLAECLIVTGAWDELEELLLFEPEICAKILSWYAPPGDGEYPFVVVGQRIAREVLARLALNDRMPSRK